MLPVIISNPAKVEQIKANFKKQGFQNLHILADFDRTLTYSTVNGQKTPSIIYRLREGKYLAPGYSEKAHALYDKYHKFENELTLSLGERKAKMQEWWRVHFELLLKSGLNKKDLQDILKDDRLRLRAGVPEFLDFLHQEKIPLIIISASGCGETIEMFFEKFRKNYPNIYYVVNRFEWDQDGSAVSVREPIIHSLNKDETILSEIPEAFKAVQNRKNVILLGDGLGDVGMIEGFDYDNLLKIGFYNEPDEKNLENYKNNFDVVLTSDADFDYVNKLVQNDGK